MKQRSTEREGTETSVAVCLPDEQGVAVLNNCCGGHAVDAIPRCLVHQYRVTLLTCRSAGLHANYAIFAVSGVQGATTEDTVSSPVLHTAPSARSGLYNTIGIANFNVSLCFSICWGRMHARFWPEILAPMQGSNTVQYDAHSAGSLALDNRFSIPMRAAVPLTRSPRTQRKFDCRHACIVT